jgi:hypothetical protein
MLELADPLGALETGEHEEVEELSVGSRPERVQTLVWSALELIRSHDAILLAIVIQYESFLRRIGAQSVTLPFSTTNPAHRDEVVT